MHVTRTFNQSRLRNAITAKCKCICSCCKKQRKDLKICPEDNGMKLNRVQVVINPSFSRHKPRGGPLWLRVLRGISSVRSLQQTPDHVPRPAEKSSKILCEVGREHKSQTNHKVSFGEQSHLFWSRDLSSTQTSENGCRIRPIL